MKFYKLIILTTSFLSSAVFAQNEERRWAVEGNIGPTFIRNKTDIHEIFGQDNGFSKYFGMEYYIPSSHFSIRLGYQSETLNLGSQIISTDQQTIVSGGRWYPAPERWAIQPHIGLSTNILVANDNTSTGYFQNMYGETKFSANISSPRISFTPSIGADLYIISSVALYIDYSYNIGINNRYNITYAMNNGENSYVHGCLNHHNLQIGLKVSFPFHFTSKDGNTILESILTTIFTQFMTTNRRQY